MVSRNYQYIGSFLPELTRLGLNMAHSFSYTDAIGNDEVVVPSFLQVSDKPMGANIVDDAGDDDAQKTVH